MVDGTGYIAMYEGIFTYGFAFVAPSLSFRKSLSFPRSITLVKPYN